MIFPRKYVHLGKINTITRLNLTYTMITIEEVLKKLEIGKHNPAWCTGLKEGSSSNSAQTKDIYSPADGQLLASVAMAGQKEYNEVVTNSLKAFEEWRKVPAPKRGEIVRQIGDRLRLYKEPLGALVSYEMGKILQEGIGEVQEMIDICDFATGLSRQLNGLTMHSERPEHECMNNIIL